MRNRKPAKIRGWFPCQIFLVMLLSILLKSSLLFAQDSIPDSEVRERLHTIQGMLDAGRPGANLWWTGWLVGYSAATVVQTSLMVASDNLSTRQDMGLGAITTLLGAAGQLVTPMTPAKAPGLLAMLSENTAEERMNKLQAAELLLMESSERERFGRSWQTHVLVGLVNISTGLVTWLAFDRDLKAGLVIFAINTAITEVQIFTQPTKAMKDYKNYLQKYTPVQDAHLSKASYSLELVSLIVPLQMKCGLGLGVKVVF
jgi:hypothetical protein